MMKRLPLPSHPVAVGPAVAIVALAGMAERRKVGVMPLRSSAAKEVGIQNIELCTTHRLASDLPGHAD